MLIGLNGRLGSGKDTVYELMQELHDGQVIRRAFADPLKVSAARSLGVPTDWPAEKCVQFCNRLKVADIAVYESNDEGVVSPIPLATLSGRQFLQNYGTEAHREMFGTDFWVDATLPQWDGMGHTESGIFGIDPDKDFLVFTDVRFANEAERIKQWGGEIWEVIRFDDDPDTHVSEQSLPSMYIDAIIDNHGTLEDLRAIVQAALNVRKARQDKIHIERIR